jgi:hypothetical protein
LEVLSWKKTVSNPENVFITVQFRAQRPEGGRVVTEMHYTYSRAGWRCFTPWGMLDPGDHPARNVFVIGSARYVMQKIRPPEEAKELEQIEAERRAREAEAEDARKKAEEARKKDEEEEARQRKPILDYAKANFPAWQKVRDKEWEIPRKAVNVKGEQGLVYRVKGKLRIVDVKTKKPIDTDTSFYFFVMAEKVTEAQVSNGGWDTVKGWKFPEPMAH